MVAFRQIETLDHPLIEAGYVGEQAAFHMSDAKARFVFGGNQGGKTFCGIREGVFYATGLHPTKDIEAPNTGWIVTLDKNLGVNEIFPTIRQLMPRDMDWREYTDRQDPRFEIAAKGWDKKSVIRLKSVEQGFEKFQAAKIRWAYFDEEPDQQVYEETMIRLLRFDGDHWVCMTPTHGMTWVWETVCQPWENGDLDDETAVFNWSTFDNPALTEKAINRLMGKIPKAKRQARIYGLFLSPEGLIWPEFDERKHVIEPFSIPAHWPQTLIMDPGHAHYFGALMGASDPAGGIVLWGNYKDHRKAIKAHVQNICDVYEKSQHHDRVDQRLYKTYFRDGIAPDRKHGKILNRVIPLIDQAAAQYREELALYGIVSRSVDKEVDAGLTRVSAWFDSVNRAGAPMIRIFRGTCKELVNELRVYSWKDVESRGSNKHQEITGQQVRKRNDDLCDPLRYFVMDCPKGKESIKRVTVPGSFDHVFQQHQQEMGRLRDVQAQNPRMSQADILNAMRGGFNPAW